MPVTGLPNHIAVVIPWFTAVLERSSVSSPRTPFVYLIRLNFSVARLILYFARVPPSPYRLRMGILGTLSGVKLTCVAVSYPHVRPS